MTAVLDASVILKRLLADPAREPDTDKALALIEEVVEGRIDRIQPVHWLAEVAAVLARVTPHTALEDVEMLSGLEFPATDEPLVMRRAVELAISTGQDLFDTLYHAVALEQEEAVLITADDRYRAKAQTQGHIRALSEWTAEG